MADLTPQQRVSFERFKVWKHRPKSKATASVPSPQEVFAEMMKATFGPLLRDQGLRGSGGRFELPSDDYWALLGFQKSAYSDGQEVQFTVNLSAIRRDVWAERAAASPALGERPKPTVVYGSWATQTRLGLITPEGSDKWWPIVRGVDPGPVAEDVVSDLLKYGLPWLREQITKRR
ncbi:DUF4304 domain-containing protein [Kribbella sandramycini]|uniref:DUF4304 domain-containing protein n=1 Tax=Kribbella sandramycini TaxID=60450 RepID=A0A7Y4NYE5_9ACTN|nr:DUF4304 domain-containing protein [Kribbella sandramycini]MBB6569284.1 hypothetical protein [Kribbella sandramycini]NOL40877.1 DUF4304 domain-containing protein [Kribbella sandramycini]